MHATYPDVPLRPGRLRSFWEMLDHNAEAFCRLSSVIGQALVLLDLHPSPPWGDIVSSLAELRKEANRMEMLGVVKVINRIEEHTTGDGRASPSTVKPMIAELYNRMRDDLEGMLFLQIEASRANFYSQQQPLFGPSVSKQFPSIAYEVEEAGKCLALDRSTASAFHSIRCLEAGIRAVARSLGIPDPTRGTERNWSAALRAVKGELESRWPASTGRMSGDAQFFDKAYGALAGMQNPYRNATMHLDDKYTADEARHLLEIVKGFMNMIANRMDERGEPLA